jgi:hypothetical protein
MMKSTSAAANDQVQQMLRELERDLPVTLDAHEACKVLHCSRRTLAKMMAAREIRVIRRVLAGSSRVIIPRCEILRVLAERVA